jgi:hypothetical protein
MSRARILGWVAAWLVVVLVGSTLVWAVISRAGKDVVAAQDPVVATTGPGPTRTTASSSPPVSSHSPSSRPSHPSSAPGSSTPPAPTYEQRTWQGVGGQLVAQCDGSAISLQSAQPDIGYAFDVKNGGPEELEVEFEGREDESGSQSTVTARCEGGVPVFDAQVEGGDD